MKNTHYNIIEVHFVTSQQVKHIFLYTFNLYFYNKQSNFKKVQGCIHEVSIPVNKYKKPLGRWFATTIGLEDTSICGLSI